MPLDPSLVQWDQPDPSAVQWDRAPVKPPQALTFAEKYLAPALENAPLIGKILRDVPQQAVRGLVQGAADPAIGVAQLAANATGNGEGVNRAINAQEADYQAKRGADGFDAWRMGGNFISPTTLLPATKLAQAGQATSALKNVLMASGAGAATNMAQPVTGGDYWDQKGSQGMTGAIMGPLGYGVTSLAAAALRPKIADEAALLVDKGVTLTPGAIFGGGFKRAEDHARGTPVLGDFIRNAQRRSFEDFNTAAINDSLAPLGLSLPKGLAGRDALKFADDHISGAYNKILDKIGAIQPDSQFQQGIGTLRAMVGELGEARQKQLDSIIQNRVLSHVNEQGYMTADAWKRADSEIGNLARTYARDPSGDNNQFGNALFEAQRQLRDMLKRSARDPFDVDALKAADQSFGLFLRPARAAASLRADNGTFTPEQLNAAVKALDPTKRDTGFMRGEAKMQDLSTAGLNVLGNKAPDSGTPYKNILAATVAGMAGHGTLPPEATGWMVPLAAVTGLASLPYTKVGQKVAQKVLAERPEWAAQAAQLLRQGSPAIGALSAPAGYALLNSR